LLAGDRFLFSNSLGHCQPSCHVVQVVNHLAQIGCRRRELGLAHWPFLHSGLELQLTKRLVRECQPRMLEFQVMNALNDCLLAGAEGDSDFSDISLSNKSFL
jgi:hypothetical protein